MWTSFGANVRGQIDIRDLTDTQKKGRPIMAAYFQYLTDA